MVTNGCECVCSCCARVYIYVYVVGVCVHVRAHVRVCISYVRNFITLELHQCSTSSTQALIRSELHLFRTQAVPHLICSHILLLSPSSVLNFTYSFLKRRQNVLVIASASQTAYIMTDVLKQYIFSADPRVCVCVLSTERPQADCQDVDWWSRQETPHPHCVRLEDSFSVSMISPQFL